MFTISFLIGPHYNLHIMAIIISHWNGGSTSQMDILHLYQLPEGTECHKTKDTLRKNREKPEQNRVDGNI